MTKPTARNDALPADAVGVRRPVAMLALYADRILALTAASACVGLLIYKFALARLLNVNWDEFYFLSHVHSLARGELALILQGSYTHLFAWLPLLPGDEMQEIVAARYVMVALLAVTVWLVWRLARVWLEGFAALVPPFVFVSMMPVLEHGGSFRADSILAPLSVASLLLLVAPGFNPRRDWLAGGIVGVAFAVTPKVVLLAPLILLAVIFRGSSVPRMAPVKPRVAAQSLCRIAIASGLVAAVLIGLHWFAISPIASEPVSGYAVSTVRKTLLDVPWFPRLDYFRNYVDWQTFPWLMIGLGAVMALVRRQYALAALVLSLLPIAFYRNAFSYYYVVMLAPASVLAGYAVAEIWRLVRRHASAHVAALLVAGLWLGFLIEGLKFTGLIAFDDQGLQRQIIAATHQIFPEPVNYIDRCGMVASYRKVNFFMSTWGMEDYRARNVPFLPKALRDQKPAFVLMNTGSLDTHNVGPRGLLPEDRELLARYFIKYWGPIRVAGTRGKLESPDSVTATVPYPGDYRLVTTDPLLVDGELHNDGDVVPVPSEGVVISRAPGSTNDAISFALLIASAKPAPEIEPKPALIFRGL